MSPSAFRVATRSSVDRRRRTRVQRRVLRVVLVGIVFAIGVAVGEALNDKAPPGRNRMIVRTLEPSTLPPVRETVTVSVPR